MCWQSLEHHSPHCSRPGCPPCRPTQSSFSNCFKHGWQHRQGCTVLKNNISSFRKDQKPRHSITLLSIIHEECLILETGNLGAELSCPQSQTSSLWVDSLVSAPFYSVNYFEQLGSLCKARSGSGWFQQDKAGTPVAWYTVCSLHVWLYAKAGGWEMYSTGAAQWPKQHRVQTAQNLSCFSLCHGVRVGNDWQRREHLTEQWAALSAWVSLNLGFQSLSSTHITPFNHNSSSPHWFPLIMAEQAGGREYLILKTDLVWKGSSKTGGHRWRHLKNKYALW